MAADHDKMGCCDDGQGGADHKAPCKPGMACFATMAALPVAGADTYVVTFDQIGLTASPARTLASRPPDRTLRPPISL